MKPTLLNKLVLCFLICSVLPTSAEIVTNSNGDNIRLNSDGTWEIVTRNSSTIYEGRSEILFEFEIWVDQAKLFIETERDSFSGNVDFDRAWTMCDGGGELTYVGSHDVVFKEFMTGTEFVNNEFPGVGLILGVDIETVYRSDNLIDISIVYVDSSISTENEEEIETVAEQATRLCNWQTLNQLYEPWAYNIDVVFSDGSSLDTTSFWDHARIQMRHKSTELVAQQR